MHLQHIVSFLLPHYITFNYFKIYDIKRNMNRVGVLYPHTCLRGGVRRKAMISLHLPCNKNKKALKLKTF